MEVAERIRVRGAELTAAERRVAEVILRAPQQVGFGTVAELAAAADVGAASVVRFATKLGYDGYSALQDSIRDDLTSQLRPAAERIRTPADSPRRAHRDVEIANVEATLGAVDGAHLDELVARLADRDRPVVLLSGEASRGVVHQFATQLHELRRGVVQLGGSDVVVRREIALLPPDATAIVVDLRRYESWVLDAHAGLVEAGAWTAGITDSVLSPIATAANVTFLATAGSAGPFDSHVGTLALLHLVAAEVAAALRETATERLARVEAAWTEHGSLTDGS